MLRELAELGMSIARALSRQAEAPDAGPEIALQFARVAKAVRQTLALQLRIEEGRLAEGCKAKSFNSPPPLAPRQALPRWKAEAVCARSELLEQAGPPAELESDHLNYDLYEWLEDRDDLADFADMPFEAIIQRLCADLDLPPAWGQSRPRQLSDRGASLPDSRLAANGPLLRHRATPAANSS